MVLQQVPSTSLMGPNHLRLQLILLWGVHLLPYHYVRPQDHPGFTVYLVLMVSWLQVLGEHKASVNLPTTVDGYKLMQLMQLFSGVRPQFQFRSLRAYWKCFICWPTSRWCLEGNFLSFIHVCQQKGLESMTELNSRSFGVPDLWMLIMRTWHFIFRLVHWSRVRLISYHYVQQHLGLWLAEWTCFPNPGGRTLVVVKATDFVPLYFSHSVA